MEFEINKLMQEAISKMSKDINSKKEALIKARVKELVGIDINLEEELKRKFNRFCTVREGSEESIYFNDGSIEGVRLITFVKKENFNFSENFNLNYEESYY